MENEARAGQTPEVSPFAGIGHADLIIQFYKLGMDPTIARELSVRLLTHAGYAGDPTVEPLIGKNGQQVHDEATGQPLVLADYLGFAAGHHRFAMRQILRFLYTEPGEPDYESGRAAYASYVDRNQSRTGKN